MINLTNNQVEAFNRIYRLKQTLLNRIVCRIYNFSIITIVIDSIKWKRFYTIKKSIIECKSCRIIVNDNAIEIRKIIRKYTYKLKKR